MKLFFNQLKARYQEYQSLFTPGGSIQSQNEKIEMELISYLKNRGLFTQGMDFKLKLQFNERYSYMSSSDLLFLGDIKCPVTANCVLNTNLFDAGVFERDKTAKFILERSIEEMARNAIVSLINCGRLFATGGFVTDRSTDYSFSFPVSYEHGFVHQLDTAFIYDPSGPAKLILINNPEIRTKLHVPYSKSTGETMYGNLNAVTYGLIETHYLVLRTLLGSH